MNKQLNLNDATANLSDAMLLLREAATAHVERYGTDLRGLVKLIQTNQSGWSGGEYNTANIAEAVIRDKAWDKLVSEIHKVPRSPP